MPTIDSTFAPRRNETIVLRPIFGAGLLLGALILAGCHEPNVASYYVPKEPAADLPPAPAAHANLTAATTAAPAAGSGEGLAHFSAPVASGPGLAWTAPAHWQSKPAGGMRKGSYTVTGGTHATADLAITAFPGDVGGEVANVNRWRGQIQLAPLTETDALAAVTRLQTNGLNVGVVDFANAGAGAEALRVIAGMVSFEGATWFFKLTGPDALVAQEKAAFLTFLQTLKPAGPSP